MRMPALLVAVAALLAAGAGLAGAARNGLGAA